MAWSVFSKRHRDDPSPQADAAPQALPAPAVAPSPDEFREILESFEAVAYVWNIAEARHSYISPQAAHILGFQLDELLRPGFWLSRVHPDDQAKFERTLTAPAGKGPLRSVEYRLLQPNGDIVWLRDQMSVTDRGAASVVHGLVTNISARKRIEGAVEASERRYRVMLEKMDVVPYSFDVQENRYTYIGAQMDKLLRIGMHAWNFEGFRLRHVHDLDRERVDAEWRIGCGSSRSGELEYRIVASDGEVIWVRDVFHFEIDVEGGGHVIAYGNLIDITAKKRAEEMLQESERRFRHLLESTDIVPYTWDLETRRFTYVGPQAEKLLGYPASSWRGEGFWLSRVHPDDRPRALEASRMLHDLKRGASEEYRMLRADDTPVWVRDIIDVDQQADGRYVAYGVMIEVTENRRQTEALIQAQKMDIIGQMTGGVAHDFNNLLTVIIANLHLVMTSAPTDAATQRRLSMISQAAERSADLTKRLLAFSRRQTLTPKTTDVNALVSGMTELLRRTLGETIEINLHLASDLWQTHVDPAQLESALVNLAVNARDAMNNAGRLDITTCNQILHADPAKSEKPSGAFVMLAVSDSGCGMTPAVLAKVFEPFFTTKEVGKGTGLGLSMVYGFASQTGGWIDVESEVGKGTVFKLYLPRVIGEVVDREDQPTIESSVPNGSETILCVDDDPQARTTVREVLLHLGYAVREAENGPSALMELHTNKDINLLLTDIVMPGGMSGVVLAKEAVRQWPELKVLYTSGYAKGHHDERGIWLPKPYSPGDLARKVREALDTSAALH